MGSNPCAIRAAFLQYPCQVFVLVEVASCCWQVQMQMQIQKKIFTSICIYVALINCKIDERKSENKEEYNKSNSKQLVSLIVNNSCIVLYCVDVL
jgi:GTP1/Obg family GTP-binding protein